MVILVWSLSTVQALLYDTILLDQESMNATQEYGKTMQDSHANHQYLPNLIMRAIASSSLRAVQSVNLLAGRQYFHSTCK